MGNREMIKEQLVGRGISDQRLLTAFELVDRADFVPADLKYLSYIDAPVQIGWGQTTSQPYVIAFMLEVLKIRSTDRVLEVGTGSTYQTAILSKLASSVYSVEIVESLHKIATKRMAGYDNVYLKLAGQEVGWSEMGPFDKIVVCAAADEIPEELVSQLADDGLMILPVGKYYQTLILYDKERGCGESVMPVRFVPLR